MNNAPPLINSDINFPATPKPELSAGDATFHLPLARVQSRLPHAQSNIGTLAITLTSEDRSRAEALALINRRYAWRGYGADHKLVGNAEETTFTARYDGRLVGTVTLGTDSRSGLAVDATFPEEMQFFRRKQNARLCELKKLAMECGADAKPVLGSMFHFVFIYGTNNCLGTDLFIEVNPRHAAFYERMLKFRRVGAVRTNDSVNAPSQLMWLPVSDIESAITNNEKKEFNSSLYRYFYSRKFEDRIVYQLNDRALRENVHQYYC